MLTLEAALTLYVLGLFIRLDISLFLSIFFFWLGLPAMVAGTAIGFIVNPWVGCSQLAGLVVVLTAGRPLEQEEVDRQPPGSGRSGLGKDPDPSPVGTRLRTLTPLRPCGKVMLYGSPVTARLREGTWVDAGVEVEILEVLPGEVLVRLPSEAERT